MNNNTNKKVILLIVLIIAAIIAAALFFFTQKGSSAKNGAKKVTIIVVHGDESEKTFEVSTSKETLGEVLLDEKIVEGENAEYGLYILSADGENADAAKEQWWCVTKEGGEVTTGADQTPISDGDQFELTLTTGF